MRRKEKRIRTAESDLGIEVLVLLQPGELVSIGRGAKFTGRVKIIVTHSSLSLILDLGV